MDAGGETVAGRDSAPTSRADTIRCRSQLCHLNHHRAGTTSSTACSIAPNRRIPRPSTGSSSQSREEIASVTAQLRNPWPVGDPLHATYQPIDPRGGCCRTGRSPARTSSFCSRPTVHPGRRANAEFACFGCETLREYLLHYEFPEYMPGAVPIGLDGGGVFGVFDLRDGPSDKVWAIGSAATRGTTPCRWPTASASSAGGRMSSPSLHAVKTCDALRRRDVERRPRRTLTKSLSSHGRSPAARLPHRPRVGDARAPRHAGAAPPAVGTRQNGRRPSRRRRRRRATSSTRRWR